MVSKAGKGGGSRSEPLVGTLAIVGVGLIGGSIGLAARQRGLAERVVGIGRRRSSLDRARRLGAIDSGTCSLVRGVRDAELVVFCTPVNLIAEQVIEASAECRPGTILTDAGSTKSRIVRTVEERLHADVAFVGAHPLAGSERRGVQHARADLFDSAVCVLTRTRRTSRPALERLSQFWQSLGSRVLVMSPEDHDHALAYTSHMPHVIAVALALSLPGGYESLAAGGFRDTTRIAASDPELWSAILFDNDSSVLEALEHFILELRKLRVALTRGERSVLAKLWSKAQARRLALGEGGTLGGE